MGYSKEDHQRAIENTKKAIQVALASGNEHDALFLMENTLPKLEERLSQSNA